MQTTQEEVLRALVRVVVGIIKNNPSLLLKYVEFDDVVIIKNYEKEITGNSPPAPNK